MHTLKAVNLKKKTILKIILGCCEVGGEERNPGSEGRPTSHEDNGDSRSHREARGQVVRDSVFAHFSFFQVRHKRASKIVFLL